MEQHHSIVAIIVTYNCGEHLERSFLSLVNQTKKVDQIIIVDNGSENLDSYREKATVIKGKITPQLTPFTFALFLNADTFLSSDFIENALHFMQLHHTAGAISGVLLGYDVAKGAPNGLYESTGIFCTPYGKWFDRDQGQPLNSHLYQKVEEVLALNRSTMLCRAKALDGLKELSWDEVGLCLDLRKKGWKLFFVPNLIAYHCRALIPC